MAFYTSVAQDSKFLLITEIENGRKKRYKYEYSPYVFVPSDSDEDNYRTLDGKRVGKFYYDNMREAGGELRNKVEWYGINQWPYQFIYETYREGFEYKFSDISVVSIDIEVAADEGFPSIELANKPVTLVTISHMGRGIKHVYGCGNFHTDDPKIRYFKCTDEEALLKSFLSGWRSFDPDIVTGWNSEMFDIPYLHNRIIRLLGKKYGDRLSPWGIVREREIPTMNSSLKVKEVVGIAQLDYLGLYKKFSYTPQESYKLDHIANSELGERKLDYSEFRSLQALYLNDFQKYTEYNIRDVELVDKLEQKKKFIEQVVAIAYRCRINFNDAMTTVRLWDVMIHNYLMDRHIVVPKIQANEEVQIPGGHVKDPIPAKHSWVLTYDVASLYPHIFMQVNISPETYRHRVHDLTVDNILEGSYDKYREFLDNNNYSMAASGCMFDRADEGFIPALMQSVFNERSTWKKAMLKYENELEHCTDEIRKHELVNLVDQAKNMQQALKIIMNGCYGALMNQYNRWFDPKLGESITLTGQAVIRWIEKAMNKYLNKVLKTEGVDYVVAVDTDSIHITLGKMVESFNAFRGQMDASIVEKLDQISKSKIEPMIAQAIKEFADYSNAFRPAIYMKREVIANRAIWVAKKRYAMTILDKEGVRYEKPKLKIQGLETVRSSTPMACRKKLEEAIEMILLKDEVTLQKFVADFKKQFMKMPFNDVAFPRTANDIEKYADEDRIYKKGTPIHVKGVLLFNHWLKSSKLKTIEPIHSGDKIKFAYLKKPNFMNSNVIAVTDHLPPEFEIAQYIDVHMQFTKAFLDPLDRLAKIAKWSAEKRDTIMDLFA